MRRLAVLAAGLLLAAPAAAAPTVLVYHQVGASGGAALGISPEALRQRVETLRGLGYRFVTSSEAARAGREAREAVIQFDDGYESVYRQAFPVLRALGVPGTAYVIWSRLNTPGFLTSAQVQELRAAGWEIGHHTVSHAALADLSPAGLRRELGPAGVDTPPQCVAYPLNRHDARVREEARRQGLTCGVAGGPPALGRLDPLALPAPAITPWDGWLLPWRARWGVDARAPLLLGGLLLPAVDGAGRSHAEAAPPLTWNPAHYELLGNGLVMTEWKGERDTRLAWREGAWSLNLAARRGVPLPAGAPEDGEFGVRPAGQYTGASLAYHARPLTLALGVDSGGPLLGAALALGGYGEVWGRASRLQDAWQWAWGATLIPVDYWRVMAAQDARGAQLGLRAAVPWQSGEGRPLRVGGGYRWGEQAGAFVDAEYRVGSYSVSAEVNAKLRWGVRFTAVW